MKIFKNYLIIASLFIIISLNAKQVGAQKAPFVPPTQPVYNPQPQKSPYQQQLPSVPQSQPYQKQLPAIPQSVQPKRAVTFRELVTTIKNSPTNVVWNNDNKLLQTNFVDDLVTDARAAEFSPNQLEALLMIARDSHAQFTGNNDQDAQILTNIDQQISNALADILIARKF
ncbi:MAG TPA: hypothetical protein VKU36_05635 [Candidatus Babeliales bacterium]|nr:hypothetical protein [Candidatus Babeliales bacterium]